MSKYFFGKNRQSPVCVYPLKLTLFCFLDLWENGSSQRLKLSRPQQWNHPKGPFCRVVYSVQPRDGACRFLQMNSSFVLALSKSKFASCDSFCLITLQILCRSWNFSQFARIQGCEIESCQYQCSYESWVCLKFSKTRNSLLIVS